MTTDLTADLVVGLFTEGVMSPERVAAESGPGA